MNETKIKNIAKKLSEPYFNDSLQIPFSLKTAYDKLNLTCSYRTFKRAMEELQERGALQYEKVSNGRAKGVQNIVRCVFPRQLNKIANG